MYEHFVRKIILNLDRIKRKVNFMTTPSKLKITMRAAVAIVTISGFISVAIYLVVFQPSFEHSESIALAGTVVGYLSAKADTIIGWYFGSSQGSAEKSDAMETLLNDDK